MLAVWPRSSEFVIMMSMSCTKIEDLWYKTEPQLLWNPNRKRTNSMMSHAFSDQITALSKSCYYHIRELRCIRPYLDFTASTTATSTVHSKLDYCNSHYHNLPNCQLNRLQQIQNSLARAVVKAPKSTHITPILKSLQSPLAKCQRTHRI